MRSEQRIINDLLEANDALEIDTYKGITLQNTTFLYVDKINGNDDAATQYFIDNPTLLNNKSVPFASYSGVAGMVEFWEARKAVADTRFIDNWPVFVNLSSGASWRDAVPSNTVHGAKRLIWSGFKMAGDFTLDHNSTLQYCRNNDANHAPVNAKAGGWSGIGEIHIFYSLLTGWIGTPKTDDGAAGYVNLYLHKTGLFNTTHSSNNANVKYLCSSSSLYNSQPFHSMTKEFYNRIYLILNKNSAFLDDTNLRKKIYYRYSEVTHNNLYKGYDRFTNSIDIDSQTGKDPLFIDPDNGILNTFSHSPCVKNGKNGQDIGLGLAFAQRQNENMSAAIAQGALRNLTVEADGLLVSHTALNVVSVASNVITLDATAPTLNDSFDGLQCRLVNAEEIREEIAIASYNGATKELTLSQVPTNSIDSTWTYYISAEIESTLIGYTITADTLQYTEKREYDANGMLLRGVYETHLKMCLREELEAGRIPQAGDSKYIASKHNYKKMQSDYVRVDATGLGSADVGFDDATAERPFSEYQQIKIKMW